MAKKKKKVSKKAPKKVSKKTAKKKVAKKVTKKAAKKVVKKPAKKAARKAAAPAPMPRATSVFPYLTFPGNCEDAFNFYRSVFGGEFGYIGRFKDMPPMEGQPPVPEAEMNKIMHISLPIGRDNVLMGSDSSDAFGHATIIGNNFSISVSTFSDEEADRIFNGLSAGGKTTMPMGKTFWGSYYGMCVDRFGIQWMVSHDAPQNK